MVDELDRPMNLHEGDFCFYYLICTPRGGYRHSEANQTVLNYKIPVGTERGLRARPDRTRYKLKAIRQYSDALVEFLEGRHPKATGESLASLGYRVGLVPIPPSMRPDSQDYDDRNEQVCRAVCSKLGLRLCHDIETAVPGIASHVGGTCKIENIEDTLQRVATDANTCEFVFLVDDVLVTGAHFSAAKSLLCRTGFQGQVFGLFLARAQY